VIRIFGDLRFRIASPALALAFAPDGTAWSVEEAGLVRHWDVATGQERLQYQLSDLETVWAFSPGGQRLASGGVDLSLWLPATGQLDHVLPQDSWVTALAFSADGQLLAAGHDDGRLSLWDAASGTRVAELGRDGPAVSALAFSADGARLASAHEDRQIRLWGRADGRPAGKLVGHTDRIDGLAWHPDGRHLISAGWDTTARVWDTATKEPLILLNAHADQVSALAFSPDGTVLATADSDNLLWLWEPFRGRVLRTLRGHVGEVSCLAFSPDGRSLLSGGADRQLLLWDVATGRPQTGAAGVPAGAARIRLSPADAVLASASGGKALRLLDAATGVCARQLEHPALVQAVAFSSDGQWLATGDDRGVVRLWPGDGAGPGRATGWQHKQPVQALAFADGQDLLASAGGTDGYVFLWRPSDGEPVLLIPEATDGCTVETVAWVPGSNLLAAGGIDWLATGGSDGAICLWDVDRRAEVATFAGGTTALAVRPDGRQLAAATLTESVCLWDLETQTLSRELLGHAGLVTCVAYRPDGGVLATGGEDGTLRLWHTGLGGWHEPGGPGPQGDDEGLLTQLHLHVPLSDLTFSADGQRLYTANVNQTVYVIDLSQLLQG
jgi:WD40 repeat protein